MRLLALAALAALSLASGARAAPDGKALFAGRCAACHQPAAAKSSLAAPKIGGVAGRKVASLPDYPYSTALKGKAAQVWTDANLNAYLAAPGKWAPGTKMMVAVPNPEERQAVVAYLKTLK